MSLFQSTRPVWGATWAGVFSPVCCDISIHAPRVGRDFDGLKKLLNGTSFQSTRPVWGATLEMMTPASRREVFQSTRPVWGATFVQKILAIAGIISIHAPRVGRDDVIPAAAAATTISIHAPRVGRDPEELQINVVSKISIHAPRVGRDSKFDDFTPSNLHKRYKRVLARPKNTREKGKIKQKLAYIHAFSAFLGCEGSGTFCALVLRTQYR